MLALGAAMTAGGIACQGVGMADGPGALWFRISGVVFHMVGAGCLAVAPSVRGGLKT